MLKIVKIVTKFQISFPKTSTMPFYAIYFCFTFNRQIKIVMLRPSRINSTKKLIPKIGLRKSLYSKAHFFSSPILLPWLMTTIFEIIAKQTMRKHIKAVENLKTTMSFSNWLVLLSNLLKSLCAEFNSLFTS